MAQQQGRWLAAGAFVLGLLTVGPVAAGPYLGDWGWCWHQGRDCPRGEYCPLHYWTPGLYKIRMYVHPSNLDQYPPGPCPPVPAGYQTTTFPCRSTPPAPLAPYADPDAYFGRQVIPR
jgi:hypothetical protein